MVFLLHSILYYLYNHSIIHLENFTQQVTFQLVLLTGRTSLGGQSREKQPDEKTIAYRGNSGVYCRK